MRYRTVYLSKLVDLEKPEDVFREVKAIASFVAPGLDCTIIDAAFEDTVKLFGGGYPGYQACNTKYHDLEHTTDAFLAMTRLIHGAFVDGLKLTERQVSLGLISALMHDTGYIQAADDRAGTGAQYTLVHINRSIEFMKAYLADKKYTEEDFEFCAGLLKCTGLDTRINEIVFESPEHEILGKMLGTADLLGQMADRCYLEKLTYLFNEFCEGRVGGFRDDLDLLERTPAFYEFTLRRFAGELGGVYQHMRSHFRARWDIDRDLYLELIAEKIDFLRTAIKDCSSRHNDREEIRTALRARVEASVGCSD